MPPQTPQNPNIAPSPVQPGVPPAPTPPRAPSKPKKDHHEGIRGILTTLLVLLLAPLIALFLTLFVFQSYVVDGPSMESTLQNRDRLIVLKLPKTWARLTHRHYIPNRGDIIIFNEKGLSSFGDSSDSKQLIKRVVGLPGERVVVKEGSLTVYNKEHPEGFSPDKTLSYGKVIYSTPGNVDLTVPAGEVFVAGDNRPNSLDSRYFGPVSSDDIVGKLAIRVYPPNGPHVF